MNIRELKKKWNKENGFYKNQELGSGVHSFVRDILESKELFSVVEGSLSTNLDKRKNEYIHENKTKQGRQADFVIYINSDIIIPLEAERYENITAGISQIANYQKDLDKHYGILTDGFIWRFYNNNAYREFTLTEILNNSERFLEFWNEYTKAENYYLSFFEPQGQNSLFQQTDTLLVENNREVFFEDITKLIKGFKNKLELEGYFDHLETSSPEKRAVEITYAYIIQFILYKTLVDNKFHSFVVEYNDIVQAIHECLLVNQYGKILGIINGISNKISKNVYKPFKEEQNYINETLLNLYSKPKNEMYEVSPWLDIFVFIKKYSFANIQNEIFGYIYENYLKELYEQEDKGQYFTDPVIVNFMLREIGYTPENIKERYAADKKSISLIDPACGSGTFLYSATDSTISAFGNNSQEKSKLVEKIVNNNIFGLDIEEFPLYLAEMNIVMRMLPLIINEKYNNPIDKKIKLFLTPDSLSEFASTKLGNTKYDFEARDGQFKLDLPEVDLGYKSFIREEEDLKELKDSLENKPKIDRFRFDYVIGNPPYVGYRKCSQQNIPFFEKMKKDEIKLSNVYGINLHSSPDRQKKYAPKPNLYSFFLALGIALLKDNGKLCFIIPQTILTSKDQDVIRFHISKYTTIERIITFSGKMFVGRGLKQDRPIATSSLILLLSKEKPPEDHKVEIINYKKSNENLEQIIDEIRMGKNTDKKEIFQDELSQNISNWNFIKLNSDFLNFFEEYKRHSEETSIYYDHERAKHKFNNRFYFDGSFNIPTKDILSKKPDEKQYWQVPKLAKEGFKIQEFGYYPKSRGIKIAQGSQGMIMLNTKYKVLWRYSNTKKFYFVAGNNIIPRFHQYCIASNMEDEIYYLFSLLNSKINFTILHKLLKSESERNFLIGLTDLKEIIRIPIINEKNFLIKNEIVKQTKEMLNLESDTLSDFIDFSNVLMQKFEKAWVAGNNLCLESSDISLSLPINGRNEIIKKKFNKEENKLIPNVNHDSITLAELKSTSVVDWEKHKKLKKYIDDLIYILYFVDPQLPQITNDLNQIVEGCKEDNLYKIIEDMSL